MVLAGGEGKRLMPLTDERAKPAVPFGGSYRLIDFALSNLINSGLRRIVVLTQYKSHSLDRHVTQTWAMPAILGDVVEPRPELTVGRRREAARVPRRRVAVIDRPVRELGDGAPRHHDLDLRRLVARRREPTAHR
jgi:hypothetical protein